MIGVRAGCVHKGRAVGHARPSKLILHARPPFTRSLRVVSHGTSTKLSSSYWKWEEQCKGHALNKIC